jgi:hypothetical protein
MNKKTIHPARPRVAKALGNHDRLATDPLFRIESTQPSVMSFLSWIDPPIGVDMSGIDSAHPNYKVSVMVVASATGGLLILPFAEPVVWNPKAAPTIRLQYQLTSTLPNDPPGLKFYETIFLSQTAPGSRKIRSRVFVAPQVTPFGSPVVTRTGTVLMPPIIKVTGIIDSTNLARTVQYQHFTSSDGLPDLFLQQPW